MVWRAPLGIQESADGGTDATPVLLDGRLFVGMGNTVLALDPATGARLWRSVLGPAIGGTARLLARDGRVFAAARDAAAFDAVTGRLLWRQPLADPAWVADAVDEEAFYVGTSHEVHAFDVATGAERWRFDAGLDWPLRGTLHGLTVSGDTVYVAGRKSLSDADGGQSGIIVAVRRQDGAVLWRWESPRQAVASGVHWAPTVVGRLLVAATVTGSDVFAFDRFTGAELWRTPRLNSGGGISQGVVIAGDTVYSGSFDGTASAHDLHTGRLLWTSPKTAASITGIAACDDRLFVTNLGFESLDRHTGARMQRAAHHGGDFFMSGPTAGDHVVYVTGSSAVYAFSCR